MFNAENAEIRTAPNDLSLWNMVKDFLSAAFFWLGYGFEVIPILPGTKVPAVKRDPWREEFDTEKMFLYWSDHPDHEVAAFIDDSVIVFDADSPESIVALEEIEAQFKMMPQLVVQTAKGQHHYFRRAPGAIAKTDNHCSEKHPERIDVKSGSGYMILPPSTGKSIIINNVEQISELTEASQEFIDAVFVHNGRNAPSVLAEVPLRVSGQREADEMPLKRLEALLNSIDADSGYEDWLHAGMSVYHETKGSDEGLALFDAWSSTGKKYKGRKEIELKWGSFRDVQNPVTIGSLIMMAKDAGAHIGAILSDDAFEICEYEVITPKQVTSEKVILQQTPLDKYSLLGMSAELEKQVMEQVFVLDDIALSGQFTVFHAAPNTGKTLLTLHLLIQSIMQGRIDKNTVYYVNVDDSETGLLEKLRIAEEYGFHMLAEGHRDFKAREFLLHIKNMIESDSARNIVIILDTLKRFTDLMNKKTSSHFTEIVRAFVMKGGTVIALAHTNKNRGSDGKPIHAGTSDIMDDCDCAYTLDTINEDQKGKTKVVEFIRKKARGDSACSVSYSYALERGITYNELLLSVQKVDESQLVPLKRASEASSDADVIVAIKSCIKEGINTKMELAKAAAKRANISNKAALRFIEKYTGIDPATSRWTFEVRERGAKVYRLLSRAEVQSPDPAIAAT